MDDWLDRFADALAVPRLDPAEVEALLDLARLVAHGTERRNAPLATFLAGRAAAGGAGAGAPSALATARGMLPGPTPGRS
ncbi:MAG: DUF6457 domain-containing protein [Acidimicrobiia bacterium]